MSIELESVSTLESAETSNGKNVNRKVLRSLEGLPISMDIPLDLCDIRTISVSASKMGRNLKAMTNPNAYLYGILNLVSEWASRVGSVTEMKSILERTTSKNLIAMMRPRSKP